MIIALIILWWVLGYAACIIEWIQDDDFTYEQIIPFVFFAFFPGPFLLISIFMKWGLDKLYGRTKFSNKIIMKRRK
jgi:hypothetical protein